MNEYKNFSNKKNNRFDVRDDKDPIQADKFLDLCQNLIDFWDEKDIDKEKNALNDILSFIDNEKAVLNQLELLDDMIRNFNLTDFILITISEIKSFEPINCYSIVLDLFLKLLIWLFKFSTSLQNQIIDNHPISLLWEISSIQVKDVYTNSIKLISCIAESGQADSEIESLLPQIFDRIKEKSNENSQYTMDLLPIIMGYCDNADQSILECYVNNILDLLYDLYCSDHFIDYCGVSLHILRLLQRRQFDIFSLNEDLCFNIIRLIDEYEFEEFHNQILRFMNLSIYLNSKDNTKSGIMEEILNHVDRILKIFLLFRTCIKDRITTRDQKNKFINIINLLLNLVVEDKSIIEKLLDNKYILIIEAFYNKVNYNIRSSIILLVWNMLNGCTSEQLSLMLSFDGIYQIIIDSLDCDDDSFLCLVAETISLMIDKLDYSGYESNIYIDGIIDKTQDAIENADFEIINQFHDLMPDYF